MSAAQGSDRSHHSDRPPWRHVLDALLRTTGAYEDIATEALAASDVPRAKVLSYYLGAQIDAPLSPSLKKDDSVEAGMPLAKSGDQRLFPSPVSGTVQAIRTRPDPRGGKAGPAILLVPEADSRADVYDGLDVGSSEAGVLRERIADAGILIAGTAPRNLAPEIERARDRTLILTTLDSEPGLRVAASLISERSDDVPAALALLKKVSSATRVVIACETAIALRIGPRCRQIAGVEVAAIPSRYPDTHEAMLRARLAPAGGIVITLEAALAALDAVTQGRLQDQKLLTVIDGSGQAIANLRVPLGTSIREVLVHLDIHPGQHDKVIVGGPLTGHAQQSLDTAIDAAMDALVWIPAGVMPEWSDEPCINCGRCVDVCPMGLQIQLIGRYSEFGLFERTPDYKIDHCIECGLCARHCIARRPLLQLVRLARQQLALNASVETGN